MSITLPEEENSVHPAARKCHDDWNDEYQMCNSQGLSDYKCREQAKIAYRAAMPDLCDQENIHAFIVCVTRGLLLEVFTQSETTKLLYAAQVAGQSVSALQKSRKEAASAPKQQAATEPEPASQAAA